MTENPTGDTLLSDLCTICHVNAPKYRCPRCSTRTCSLPCSRRHKLWSQCSGVRDPAAYLRRNELATETAFDRDFNFITGVERSLERAERDAENRGIPIDRELDAEEESGIGKKRKRLNTGLVKGEAGFLRGAENGGVRVVRAPRGMTRNKQNTSKWHPKHKCLIWTVEWMDSHGERRIRNSLETSSVAEAYDRANPRPKEERMGRDQTQEQQSKENKSEDFQIPKQTASNSATPLPDETNPSQSVIPPEEEEARPEENTSRAATSSEVEPAQPNINDRPDLTPTKDTTQIITSHRDVYFYLHRPRTSTKQPVLIPLPPNVSLATALRNRTVLEFPSIYTLPQSPETLLAEEATSKKFILEEEYLRTEKPDEESVSGIVDGRGAAEQDSHDDEEQGSESGPNPGLINLENVDESKVLEVLKQDLFENVAAR